MKLANIVPIPLLKRYGRLTKYHLVLSYLVKESEEYADFYKSCSEKGDYIIIDTSVIELGKPLTIQEQLPIAERVGASEVMCADYPMDKDRTLEATANDLSKIPKDFPYKIFAVAQGKNFAELVECYKELIKFDRIDTIGFSFTMSIFWKVPVDRYAFTEYLVKSELLDKTKEYHLLGTGFSGQEISLQSKFKWLRGVDSRLAVIQGLDNKTVSETRTTRSFDFYSSEDNPLILNNIKTLKKWAKGR